MDLPERSISHIIESDAIDILKNQLPKTWIVREITERDYGIDLYAEIVGKDRKVSGKMIALQVKGKKNIKINEGGNLAFYGIKASTLNYWLKLPVPVFFIVVDITAKVSYWLNVRDANRSGAFIKNKNGDYNVSLNSKLNLSTQGINVLQMMYIREERWQDIENAIINSLMSFTSFGPFILMCKRKRDEEYCTTTVQYLLLRYYEYYELLSRYVIGKKPKNIREWYDIHMANVLNHRESNLTFRYSLVKEIIEFFAPEYRNCVHKANLLVAKQHVNYYSNKYPLLVMHLQYRPLTFCESDWYARYYHDEYERDTQNIEEQFFEDFTEYDDFDLIDDLNV